MIPIYSTTVLYDMHLIVKLIIAICNLNQVCTHMWVCI